MREIKFRAWSENSKCFLSNDIETQYITDMRLLIDMNGEPFIFDKEKGALMHQLGILISQFTGLHDANGKEIYEGDIISFCWEGVDKIGRIAFDGSFILQPLYEGKVQVGNRAYQFTGWLALIRRSESITEMVSLDDVFNTCGKAYVIGNVYENPELLEAK